MSVSAKKDANGTWRIQFRYKDWKGESHKTQKRGFRTKKEAEDWLSVSAPAGRGHLHDIWRILGNL